MQLKSIIIETAGAPAVITVLLLVELETGQLERTPTSQTVSVPAAIIYSFIYLFIYLLIFSRDCMTTFSSHIDVLWKT